jgi:hypothetical protein
MQSQKMWPGCADQPDAVHGNRSRRSETLILNGNRGGERRSRSSLRRATLYPAELRVHAFSTADCRGRRNGWTGLARLARCAHSFQAEATGLPPFGRQNGWLAGHSGGWNPTGPVCVSFQMEFPDPKPWNLSVMFKNHARHWCAIVVLFAVSLAAATGARADDMDDRIAATQNMPDALKNGELVFHGNYCGTGNRAGSDPIDALDVACMRHDACTPTGQVQSCACNARLAKEAGAVARDSRQPAELRSLATLTATAATAGMVLCLPGPLVADRAPKPAPVPPRPIERVDVPAEAPAAAGAPVAIVPPAASETPAVIAPPTAVATSTAVAPSTAVASSAAIAPPAAVEPSAPAPLAPPLELVAPVAEEKTTP